MDLPGDLFCCSWFILGFCCCWYLLAGLRVSRLIFTLPASFDHVFAFCNTGHYQHELHVFRENKKTDISASQTYFKQNYRRKSNWVTRADMKLQIPCTSGLDTHHLGKISLAFMQMLRLRCTQRHCAVHPYTQQTSSPMFSCCIKGAQRNLAFYRNFYIQYEIRQTNFFFSFEEIQKLNITKGLALKSWPFWFWSFFLIAHKHGIDHKLQCQR